MCLIVYDVSSGSTFEKVGEFVKEFKLHAGKYGTMALVANKVCGWNSNGSLIRYYDLHGRSGDMNLQGNVVPVRLSIGFPKHNLLIT